MNYKKTNIQQEHQEDTETTPKPIVSELHQEARKKLEVIQTLLEPCDRNTYGHKLREGAMKLGISV